MSIKKLLLKVDHLKEAASQITYLPPKELITNNRKDILYRIDFLNKIINKKNSPKETLYYQFVSDTNRSLPISADDMVKNFTTLYYEIKSESIKKPITVGKFDSEYINTRYFLNNQKTWKVYRNENEYQLIDGAHRLAIAEFLEHEKVDSLVCIPAAVSSWKTLKVDRIIPPAKYLTLLCHQVWASDTYLPSITEVPILFLSGLQDEIVPYVQILSFSLPAPLFPIFLAEFLVLSIPPLPSLYRTHS